MKDYDRSPAYDRGERRPAERPSRDASDRARAESALEPGEKIVWIGRPVPKFFTDGWFAPVLFGIMWSSLSGFICGSFLWNVWFSDGSGRVTVNGRSTTFAELGAWDRWFITCFCAVFLYIGVGILLSPVWNYLARRKTFFVVTDRRAIRFFSRFKRSTKPADMDMGAVPVKCRDGLVNVWFRTKVVQRKHGSSRVPDGFKSLKPADAEAACAALRAILPETSVPPLPKTR